MTDEKKQSKKKEFLNREIAYGITGKEWITSLTAGVVGGLFTAAATIRKHFHDELKSWPGFDRLNLDHKAKLIDKNNEYLHKPTGWKEHREVIGNLKDEYAIAREIKLLSEAGIFSKGFWKGTVYGTYQRLGFLGKNTTNETFRNAFIGAAITAGAIISFFNGVASRDRIERIEGAVTAKITAPQSSPPDAPPETLAEKVALPDSKVTKIANHDKLVAANDAEIAVRA